MKNLDNTTLMSDQILDNISAEEGEGGNQMQESGLGSLYEHNYKFKTFSD